MAEWSESGVLRIWRVLGREDEQEETWRFASLVTLGGVNVSVGYHFPLSREAVIFQFAQPVGLEDSRFPTAKGFDILPFSAHEGESGRGIGLVRRSEASREIFIAMALDIVRTLERTASEATRKGDALHAILERLKEWQSFMTRGPRPLSRDKQLGLFGELCVLEELLDSKLAAIALDCWQGPIHSAQDFHIYEGAVEVKATLETEEFLAKISNIEQLDSEKEPLVLCALRLEESPAGVSLPDFINELRERFAQMGVEYTFNGLLLTLGYFDEHQDRYAARWFVKESRLYVVDDRFPYVARRSLGNAIRSVSYVIDLDLLDLEHLGLTDLVSIMEPANES